MTNKQPQQRYELGMVGLGVMERNLVMNIDDCGCAVAGYDKDQPKVEAKIEYNKTIEALD
jgi:6-phosphogluconate dehydrogenase